MAQVTIDIDGINEVIDALGDAAKRVAAPHILWRVLARARRDLARLFANHIKREIRATTTRRTGALLKVQIRPINERGRLMITLSPTFPQTRYQTPLGRGRQGASKQGQYAFVLNSRREFIQRAVAAFSNDPRVNEIIEKHLRFIINQLEQRTRT